MADTPSPPPGRPELGAVAVGGAVGAAITYVTQAEADDATGGPAGLPTATFLLVVLGALAMGLLIGLLRHRRPGPAHAAAIGLLCGLTPLAGYAAVGLTVRSRSGSTVFLVGTPLFALTAGIAGLAIGYAFSRRRADSDRRGAPA